MKLVRVFWRDSSEASGWQRISELEPDCLEMESVGWLLDEKPDQITLAGHVGYDADGKAEQACSVMTIPVQAVTGMEILEPGGLDK